jgi:hypothetical protein
MVVHAEVHCSRDNAPCDDETVCSLRHRETESATLQVDGRFGHDQGQFRVNF